MCKYKVRIACFQSQNLDFVTLNCSLYLPILIEFFRNTDFRSKFPNIKSELQVFIWEFPNTSFYFAVPRRKKRV